MIGKTLSHYRIISELGRGGMGIVYKAEDTKLDRIVAIKVLPAAALTSGTDRARFYREAKAAAALTHPHIAIIHGVDEAVPEGASSEELRPFIAMEFIDGETLEDRIEKAPLKLDEAVRIASEIASALQLAHEKEIVHRDVKSANVMLTKKGTAKVLDFGLAQTAASTKLTRLGSTLGTVSFMSPEQACGEEVDQRTDIFSLGVVLYQMITGQLPFGAQYEQAVVYSILNEDPEPITALRSGVPMELERIVNKCLAKEASRRYQHCDDLIADLSGLDARALKGGSGSRTVAAGPAGMAGAAVAGPTVAGAAEDAVDASADVSADVAARDAARSASTPVRKRLHWPSISILTAILASLATWALMNNKADSDTVRVTFRSRITIEPITEMSPSINPAGNQIVYAAGIIGDMRLYYRLIEGGPPTKLVQSSNRHQNYPSYSPDGNSVLFDSGGSIYAVEALGGVPRPIIEPDSETGFYEYATWSPSGDAIAFSSNNDSLHVLQLGSSSPYLSISSFQSHSLSWSPDGRYVAFVRHNTLHARRGSNIAPSSIWLMDTTDGVLHRITTDEFMDLSPKWTPDGTSILFVSSKGGGLDVYMQKVSSAGVAIGTPARLTIGLNLHSIDISMDGLQLVVNELDYRQNIWASELQSGVVAMAQDRLPITSGDQVIEGFAISPDGTRLAYDSNARGLAHLFVIPLSGGMPFQVTDGGDPDFLYDWSPYTDKLSYHTFNDGNRDIGIVSDNGLTAESVSDGSFHEVWPFWIKDGNTIAYHRFTIEPGVFELIQKSRDSSGAWGAPELIVDELLLGAQWSSARNRVAYIFGEKLYLWGPDAGEPRVFLSTGELDGIKSMDFGLVGGPTWSRDGSLIYFRAADYDGSNFFWAAPLDGSLPYKVVDLTGLDLGFGVPKVYDDRIYYTLSEFESDIWVLDLAW